MKSKFALFTLLAVLLCMTAALSQNKPDPNELVTVEKTFAKAVADHGMNAGFRQFLAPDGIMFRPGPVNGLAQLKDKPESTARLSWEPKYVEITSAGDLGWTTGPWELRVDSTQPPGLFGQYLSIWKRQTDGSLKLALDIGVVYPEGRKVADVGFTTLSAASAEPLSAEVRESAQKELMVRDRQWAIVCTSGDKSDTLRSFTTADVLLLRTGRPPVMGHAALGEFLAGYSGLETRRPAFAAVSAHGEFGYTYGVGEFLPAGAEFDETEPFAYATLWRRNDKGEWKLAADVTTPLPQEDNSEEKQ